ncbi:MAG TPA: HAD family phosphatase [Kiloniellaceae bacterium]|nr:HAD family phosphatase [Kiloniellaceae bacterium]
MSAIDAVVFDVGNVLIEWDPRHLYRKIFRDKNGRPDEARVSWFLETICTQAWNEQQDAGRSLAAGTAALTAQHPAFAAEIAAYYDRFHEMIPGEIAGSVELLKALKARGRPLYGLSNYTRETFRETKERFGFFALFDGIVVSGEEGVMKPDPDIFRRLIARYRLRPESAFFIDDNRANVEAAAALGFATHHFQDAEGLARHLTALELL